MYKSFGSLKKNIVFIIILIAIISFLIIILNVESAKKINEIKNFISGDTKVLYIVDDNNYSDYPIELFEKYEVNYMYINSTSLSLLERKSLEELINSQYLNNIIVIYRQGKIENAIIDFESEKSLNIFLQDNLVIPKIIGKIDGLLQSVNNYKQTDLTLLYIPYDYVNGIDSQDELFSTLCQKYDVNYAMINAYLLSETQKQKLNSILEVSSVEDQIVILIKNRKIIGRIRGLKDEFEYIEELHNYNFINSTSNNFNNIDYSEFINILSSDEKNIVLIGKDDCKYCEEVVSTLNPIVEENNLKINYLKSDDSNANSIESKLFELGYDLDISVPMLLIVESNKILDYSIGSSPGEYFIQILTENGIIK